MVWVRLDENKNIIETLETLPKNTPKVSGLNLLSEAELKLLGYYKIVPDLTPVEDWQTFTKEIGYDIDTDKVSEIKTIIDIPLTDYKDKKYAELSKEAQEYILSQYPLTIQLSAREGWYGEPKSTEIVDWVHSMFDKILLVKATLYAYSTYEEVRDIYFKRDISQDETPVWQFWGE